MKKLSLLIPAFALLSACSSYEPDIYDAEAKRMMNREEARMSMGCQFVDTQSAYRECLMATYNRNRPKTYSITVDESGRSVAVVSNGVIAPVAPTGAPSAPVQEVEVAQTVAVQPAAQPVPAPQPQVIPINQQGQLCEGLVGSPCVYQTQGEVYEMQMPPVSCGEQPCPPMVEEPKKVTVTTTETVTEKPIEVVPMPEPLPEKTWWETYQEEKEPSEPKIVCPCPDPNDPCPQCVEK